MHAVFVPPLQIQLLQRLWIWHIPDTNNPALMKRSKRSFQDPLMNILLHSLQGSSSNIVSVSCYFFRHYLLFVLYMTRFVVTLCCESNLKQLLFDQSQKRFESMSVFLAQLMESR